MSFLKDLTGGNPFATPAGQLVEAATADSHASEDWSLMMEICDRINESEEGPKDAVKAIRKRLTSNMGKNNTIVLYTLLVLETCVKNCGHRFHIQIAHKDFLQDLVKVIAPKHNPPTAIQEKVLSMIQTWADAFQGKPDLREVGKIYQELKSKGVEFPMTNLDSLAPIHTPAKAYGNTYSQSPQRAAPTRAPPPQNVQAPYPTPYPPAQYPPAGMPPPGPPVQQPRPVAAGPVTLMDLKKEENCENTDELDELLTEALGDFEKFAVTSPQGSEPADTAADTAAASATVTTGSGEVKQQTDEKKYSPVAASGPSVASNESPGGASQASAAGGATASPLDMNALLNMGDMTEVTSLLMSALGGDQGVMEDIEKRATQTQEAPPAAQASLETAFQEAVRSLAQNADDLHSGQSAEGMDDELAQLMQELGQMGMPMGLGEQGDGLAGMEPAMNNIMSMLLSRDVFYPAIKGMTEKYPAWLEKNGPSLAPDELQRYKNQEALMREISATYEDSSLTDQVCAARVTQAMERMQDLGLPPQEISNNLPTPNMASQDQCVVM